MLFNFQLDALLCHESGHKNNNLGFVVGKGNRGHIRWEDIIDQEPK